jgi:hypothetical protein
MGGDAVEMTEAVYKALSGGRSLAAENRALNAMAVPELVATVVAGTGTYRAAAAVLGVHVSTLRRWRAGGKPLPDRHGNLRTVAKAAMRRARMGPRREKKLRGAVPWTIAGRVYVRSGKNPGADDRRRTLRVGIDRGTGSLEPALDAYLAGDDQGAAHAVERELDAYVAGMAMAPGEVESLNLG